MSDFPYPDHPGESPPETPSIPDPEWVPPMPGMPENPPTEPNGDNGNGDSGDYSDPFNH